MPQGPTLRIRQLAPVAGRYPIRLNLRRPDQPDLEGEALVDLAIPDREQEDLRWYLEDYLQNPLAVEAVQVQQIETGLKERGEALYRQVLAANLDTQAIWFAVRSQLADLRIEVSTGVAESAAIPWELMRDPQSDSALALRVRAVVRVQSNPNLDFVAPPPAEEGRIRLLYVVCRPGGTQDVPLRAIANRLLQGLGDHRPRFELKALRPPTYEQLQKVLTDAKESGRPFHIVHFDGHGIYAELAETPWKDWLKSLSHLTLGAAGNGRHGYLFFEHPTNRKQSRPVPGEQLGQLLHDTGVPVLVLNACQSAMHQATPRHQATDADPAAADAHAEVRAIGSLAQAVVDQGIPAVLGMRYKVFVVTAAQYVGELYAALAKGRGFGQAASEARRHLHRNPERWVRLTPRALQDWVVPVVFEAMDRPLLDAAPAPALGLGTDSPTSLDPAQRDPVLRRLVPDRGFVGRDETLLLLDRAFDAHPICLLHAYAGQGKTATSVEFARWYAETGGLGPDPLVVFTSFATHTDLADILNQAARPFARLLQANGIEWHAVNDPERRRALILGCLRAVPVLWIWDNLEPVAGFPAGTESAWSPAEQAELKDFLKQIKLDGQTKARLLLTSRRPEQDWLGGIPERIPMPPMSSEDAARLALTFGEERGLDPASVGDWHPLLDYCAGNPLTLRVLAGQAATLGLSGAEPIARFVQAVRDGEQAIADCDAAEGRDRSLGASLDYGFRRAFAAAELPVIALLRLFQGVVDVDALEIMGRTGDHALPELQSWTRERLAELLDRAAGTGLLTHRGGTWYDIHPALPWFLGQVFGRHYDGAEGRSSADAALRAWVDAAGTLGNYYFDQIQGGNRDPIHALALEEPNLLQARRLARCRGWWYSVISAMQGLRVLYEYQGCGAKWSRLVEEIVPDYCTAADGPVPGREEGYSLVMGYRVHLAATQDLHLTRAAELQGRAAEWARAQAAEALSLPEDAALDAWQRYLIRTLGISVFAHGQIQRQQGSPGCVAAYEEDISLARRTGDRAGEATTHLNLGHAYKDIAAIRNLDAAEAAYRRSLDLRDPKDGLGRSKNIRHIGMVHHERFQDALKHQEPQETPLRYAQMAESRYLEALRLCPPDAIADLGATNSQLGAFYTDVGDTDRARQHLHQAANYFERSGDRFNAGQTRFNLALCGVRDAQREPDPSRRRDLLDRARAYAESALRDYRHYQGRAADAEAKAQRTIADIDQALAAPPDP